MLRVIGICEIMWVYKVKFYGIRGCTWWWGVEFALTLWLVPSWQNGTYPLERHKLFASDDFGVIFHLWFFWLTTTWVINDQQLFFGWTDLWDSLRLCFRAASWQICVSFWEPIGLAFTYVFNYDILRLFGLVVSNIRSVRNTMDRTIGLAFLMGGFNVSCWWPW